MKFTPEQACQNYATAAIEVRRLTGVIRGNHCVDRNDSGATCLDEHWTVTYDGAGREVPSLEHDDMCERCQLRLAAINDRKEWRRKLGAAKRSVESVGKRVCII